MKKYRIIYADPPWYYHNNDAKTASNNGDSFLTTGVHSSSYTKKDGSKGTCRPLPYKQMREDELKALPVDTLADKDCTLFTWSTSYFLDQAMRLMDVWGFQFRSIMVWDKMMPLMGTYNRGNVEFLLVGGKGKAKPNFIDRGRVAPTGMPNAIYAERRTKHSVKPEWFVTDYIDKFWPDGNRIELFARRARAGWDVWGNEVESDITI